MSISNLFNIFKHNSYAYEDIHLIKQFDANEQGKDEVYPMHRFGIYLDSQLIGTIDFRESNDPWLYWGGHIGYNIAPNFRGNGYAFKACKALESYMKECGFNQVYISASPDNIASVKTIEKLGAILIDVAQVPQDHWLIKQKEPIKSIYLWKF